MRIFITILTPILFIIQKFKTFKEQKANITFVWDPRYIYNLPRQALVEGRDLMLK